MKDIIKKRDIILVLIILLAAGAVFLWQQLTGKTGACVEITVGDSIVGTYTLYEDRDIELNGGTNVLSIKDGEATMTYADCPDQICAEHAPVSRDGENIICLPNRVFVKVCGGEEGYDDVAF